MLNLAWIFLKLGATSFGGPAAHVAMMEEEFVHRRKWLTREKFLDLVALTQLIPGPNSTELAIHIGFLRAGWKGFWIAGLCFILPAFLIVTLIAAFYVHFASLPQVGSFLLGVKAVVLALILVAFFRFSQSLFKVKSLKELRRSDFWFGKETSLLIFILLASVYLRHRGSSEILILLNSALVALFLSAKPSVQNRHELGSIFWVFFKIGSLLFGSGYVLLSFLQSELIEKRQWLSNTQILDAISVGQFTPGPVFTTASFVGYLLHGIPGAVMATLGIFLPAFLFVALSIPAYEKLKSNHHFQRVLNGVVAGSLGLLAWSLWTMGQDMIYSPFLLLLFAISLILLLYKKAPSPLLILLGGFLSFFGSKI